MDDKEVILDRTMKSPMVPSGFAALCRDKFRHVEMRRDEFLLAGWNGLVETSSKRILA